MENKRKFSLSMLIIAILSLFSPSIVSSMLSFKQGVIVLDASYYFTWSIHVISMNISLVFLAFLSYVIFIKANK